MTDLDAFYTSLREAEQSDGNVRLIRGALADYLDDRNDPNAAEHRLWLALDDIRRDPDNDALRLAWADTLERYKVQPYPKLRAEFVRVQVELDQQRNGTQRPIPSTENDLHQDKLGQREYELFGQREYELFDGYNDTEVRPHIRMWCAPPLSEYGHHLPYTPANEAGRLSPSAHVVWRRGWPSALYIDWARWHKHGDTILKSVPGLDLVYLHDRPIYDNVQSGNGFMPEQHATCITVAGKRLVFPTVRRMERTYPPVKEVLSLRWPDVRQWRTPYTPAVRPATNNPRLR